MNVKGILRYAFSIMYRKKGFFFLELIMVVLSVCLLNHAFIQYYDVNRSIITLKDNIDRDVDTVYKVSFGNAATIDENNGKAVFDFMQALRDMEGLETSGAYYVELIGLVGNEAEITVDTLFMDAGLLDIHQLKNTSGADISLYTEDDYVSLVVGNNLKDIMPVGSRWTNPYYGRKYIVTDVLRQGETWMTTSIIQESNYALCLDDMLLTLFDEESFIMDGYMTSFTFSNNVFFVPEEGAEDTEERIGQLGESVGCPVTVKSVSALIQDYRETYRELYAQTNFQVFLMTVITALGLLMTTVIALGRQRNNLLVMHIYGVSLREHKIIHAINQGVLFAVSFWVAYQISFLRMRNLYGTDINYVGKVLPFTLLLVLLLFAGLEYAAGRMLHAYLSFDRRNGE